MSGSEETPITTDSAAVPPSASPLPGAEHAVTAPAIAIAAAAPRIRRVVIEPHIHRALISLLHISCSKGLPSTAVPQSPLLPDGASGAEYAGVRGAVSRRAPPARPR
ncbi:hypothetical protein GCM10010280_25640 [Streptomyces pilosus]|uniref:Uncharacterized protein n=1 Tax=Streptomyces pilosus TaxID=28893 RepID=A0A918BLN1_9ACTN|nr:hypothetical protein GCM10010280_25640 [Streptomyces pilosus]